MNSCRTCNTKTYLESRRFIHGNPYHSRNCVKLSYWDYCRTGRCIICSKFGSNLSKELYCLQCTNKKQCVSCSRFREMLQYCKSCSKFICISCCIKKVECKSRVDRIKAIIGMKLPKDIVPLLMQYVSAHHTFDNNEQYRMCIKGECKNTYSRHTRDKLCGQCRTKKIIPIEQQPNKEPNTECCIL